MTLDYRCEGAHPRLRTMKCAMSANFVRAIRPKRERSGAKEPLRRYCRRTRSLLPNFPTNVLVQWLFRHDQFFIPNWGWLDFRNLAFEKQTWATDRVLQLRARDDSIPEHRRSILFDDRWPTKTWLEKYMASRGTWPRPILVFCTADVALAPAARLPQPYVLMEGHRRLGYIRALADHNLARPAHSVWLVTHVTTGAGLQKRARVNV